jgi:hypothetical protein
VDLSSRAIVTRVKATKVAQKANVLHTGKMAKRETVTITRVLE